MKASWPSIPLGDVLQQRPPDVRIEPTERYQFAGVYSFARGVFRAQERMGTETSYKMLTRLAAGEFVYPKLMAWEGGFGVVPPECDGCYVSPEFPVFAIDSRRIMPRWLELYFKVPAHWQKISGGSIGTNVRRRRLYPEDLLKHKLACPSLDEQSRIVARIDALETKVAVARGLRNGAAEELNIIMRGRELEIWPELTLVSSPTLNDLTSYLARGRQSEQGESGHHLIKTQHVQMGRYVPTMMRLAPHVAVRVQAEALAKAGDILIACSAAGCLGRVARFFDSEKVASTDTHVAIARPDPDEVNPDYLYAYLAGAQGQIQLRSRERGDWQRDKVGFRLTELNVADMRRVPVPLPSRLQQREIVTELQALQAKVDGVYRLQSETAAELSAVLPAILDKAFKGEL